MEEGCTIFFCFVNLSPPRAGAALLSMHACIMSNLSVVLDTPREPLSPLGSNPRCKADVNLARVVVHRRCCFCSTTTLIVCAASRWPVFNGRVRTLSMEVISATIEAYLLFVGDTRMNVKLARTPRTVGTPLNSVTSDRWRCFRIKVYYLLAYVVLF